MCPNFNRYVSDPAAFLHLNLHNPSFNVKGRVQPKLLSRTASCGFCSNKTNVSTFFGEKHLKVFRMLKQPSSIVFNVYSFHAFEGHSWKKVYLCSFTCVLPSRALFTCLSLFLKLPFCAHGRVFSPHHSAPLRPRRGLPSVTLKSGCGQTKISSLLR